MEIRKATEKDLNSITEIYTKAREFMAMTGNSRQWCITNYPPIELTEYDIKSGKLYICAENGIDAGVFFYDFGENAEPLYSKFSPPSPYGVVHRIASNGKFKGVGRFCLSWAIEQSKGRLAIDTHPDNKVMQKLLASLDFIYVGDINILDDDDIRLTYFLIKHSV